VLDVPVPLQTALADRYRLERELGQGGMATVYLAHDLRHDRKVAIKVLRPELAATIGPDRFLREIRIAAQLQHPHILPLLDSGEAAGFLYYVMPYVEGESLRTRLTRSGELPIHEAVKLVTEIVDALSYAHSRGVVHRDIKPDNVMLSGRHALVMDFGVAKAVSEASGKNQLTTAGVALGTPAYMAPEQAAADPHLDHRVDIYAVGVLAYELLSGRPPFVGGTPQQVLAAHVTESPEPVTRRRPGLSAALEQTIMKCLAKRPADRWQSADELLTQLEPLATPSGGMTPTGTMPVAAALPTRSLKGAWIGLAAALVLGLAIWLWLGPVKAPRVLIGQTAPVTNDPGLEIDPALSPDGSLLAYAVGPQFATRIYVRQTLGGRPVPVGDSGGPGQRGPRWSPDGHRILYVVNSRVMVVPALGGQAQQLVQHRDVVTGADWSPDGKQVAFTAGDSLYSIPSDGGAARAIAAVNEAHSPAWAPNGRSIALVAGNSAYVTAELYGNLAVSNLMVVSAEGGRAIPVTEGGWMNMSPAWSPDGRWLLFVSNRDGPRDVFIVGVTAAGRPRGAPERLTTGLRPHTISLAANGRRLAYNTYLPTANIWAMPMPHGSPVNASLARQLTSGTQVIEDISISPDRKWILYDSDRSGRGEVYRIPSSGGEPTQLTDTPGGNYVPTLSPDGREIAFQSQRNGNRDLFLMPFQGGPAQPLVVQPGGDNIPLWSPDGRQIAYGHVGGGQPDGLYVIERSGDGTWRPIKRVRDRGGMPLASGVVVQFNVSWAPDGKGLLVTAGDSLLLLSTEGASPRLIWARQRSTDPGFAGVPMYSPDGTMIFFLGRIFDPALGIGVWELPAGGGTPREIVRFDDPYHLPLRGTWATDGSRLCFTIDDRQSDIWTGDVSGLP
jgi:serine/threonine-protein kinase